jgi:enterochelin esterase-like enzyme
MDDERAALIAALLVVAAGAAVATVCGGRVGTARVGAVVALVAVQVGPFLVRGTQVPATPGLTAHPSPAGWILQPLGMTLLGCLAASLGAATGMLVRHDLAALLRLLGGRRGAWAALPVVAIAVQQASAASVVALQDGPVGALYAYSQPAAARGTASSRMPARPSAPSPVQTASRTVPLPPTLPDGCAPTTAAPQRAAGSGRMEGLLIGCRRVDAYLPAEYDRGPQRAFPVLYLLHGYPGGSANWLGAGGQLPAVLDQLTASGALPPTIAVLPDGNGDVLSDAEWGDTVRGDHVEGWLTTEVVPAIDRRYRTLDAGFRGIAGLSSGGFGAVNLALRHPDVFRWAASYSGFFQARTDVFGPTAPANSPDQTVSQLDPTRRMPLYVGVGAGDREYVDAQRRFVRELQGLGWEPLRSHVVAGGHGWEAWRAQMADSLAWLGTLWGTAAEGRQPPSARAARDRPAGTSRT